MPTDHAAGDVSVVIPCYTEQRWDQLVAAVASARTQLPAPVETVVVVDHNEALAARLRREVPDVTVLSNAYQRGVSGTRNTGVFHTTTPIVALLDDDARARPDWLSRLVEPFSDPAVVGTGGAISPVWDRPRPSWFPDEFLWTVASSYTGMPTTTAPVRNVWSANMAVRRASFDVVGGFRVGFGKVGDRSRPEDTELCLRMSAATGGRWMYVPGAQVDHPVPIPRTTKRYFVTRCYHEGRGKVEMARLNPGQENLGSERDYLRRTLPRAVRRGVTDTLRGRGLANTAKAAAVITGVAAAAVGGIVETAKVRRKPTPATPVTQQPSGQQEPS
jgi:GT2 family glycosyltransferase